MLEDRTQVSARLDGDSLVITAAGPAHTLAECGEQLAWISTTLWPPVRGSFVHVPQSSPPQDRVVYYHTPSIIRRDDVSHSSGSASICFDILVEQSLVPPEEDCWTSIVGVHPVAVPGFPIRRQPGTPLGLDLSFAMLEAVGYRRKGLDSRNIRLHGPERVLALVKRISDQFIWADVRCFSHRCFATDDSELPRNEKHAIHSHQLARGHHIVVTCENICKKRKNIAPSTPVSRRAGPGVTDGDADASQSSEMLRPDSPNSCYGGGTTAGMEQQDAMPSLRDVQLGQTCSAQALSSTDTSFDPDLLSMSDLSESISSLDRRHPIMPLLRASMIRWIISGYQASFKTATSGSGTTGSTNQSAAPPCTFPGLSQSGQGKKRQQDSDDNDDAPCRPPPGKRYKPHGSGKTPERILACPFWKANPDRYHRCFSLVLTRIRDVKQHLSRKHRPEFYCDRCSTIFRTEQDRREHVSNPAGRVCTPSAQLDGISHYQQTQISRKSNPKLSDEQQWFALWDIVFPGRAPPASAYRIAGISEDMCAFRDSIAANDGAIFEAAAQRMIDSGQWSEFEMVSEEARRTIMRWLARDGLDLAFGEWIATRASSQSNSGTVSAQDATPAVPSLTDSGVAVETEPPASESRLDAASLQNRGSESVEEGVSGSLQEAARQGEDGMGLTVPESLYESVQNVPEPTSSPGFWALEQQWASNEEWAHDLTQANYDFDDGFYDELLEFSNEL